jgi:hypothetical protein
LPYYSQRILFLCVVLTNDAEWMRISLILPHFTQRKILPRFTQCACGYCTQRKILPRFTQRIVFSLRLTQRKTLPLVELICKRLIMILEWSLLAIKHCASSPLQASMLDEQWQSDQYAPYDICTQKRPLQHVPTVPGHWFFNDILIPGPGMNDIRGVNPADAPGLGFASSWLPIVMNEIHIPLLFP